MQRLSLDKVPLGGLCHWMGARRAPTQHQKAMR